MEGNLFEGNKKHNGSIVREENIRAYKTPSQKQQTRVLIIVIGVIALLGAGAFFFISPREEMYDLKSYTRNTVKQGDVVQTTQASGVIDIPKQLLILSPEQGYARDLLAQEGDNVKQGQFLARLSAPDLDEELADAKTGLEDARRNLEKFETQGRFTVSKLKREITSLSEDVEENEEEVIKLEELVKINASRQSELDKAMDSLDSLKEEKEEKEISLSEEIQLQDIDRKLYKAEIAQLETRITRLEKRIDDLLIRSTMDGEILEVESSLGVPGSFITANKHLFTVVDPSSAIAELEVLEDYAGLVTPGQEIDLSVAGTAMKGEILGVGKIAQASSDGLGSTIPVKVKPINESTSLLLGSSVIGTIELGRKKDVLILPRGPYLTTGSQRYLYVIDGNIAVKKQVTFGDIQGNDVEVITGLKPGDQVITSGYQNFIEYDSVRLGKGE